MTLTQGEDMGNIPPMTQKSVATSQEENAASSLDSTGSTTLTFELEVPTQVDSPTQVDPPTHEQQLPRSDDEEDEKEERVLNLQPPPSDQLISSPEYDRSKLDPESSESVMRRRAVTSMNQTNRMNQRNRRN